MTHRRHPLHRSAALLAACLLLGGCIYKINIQQGNLLEEEDVERVAVGMTRSQVQFLLGTPMVADAFHQARWDYPYYFRDGRSGEVRTDWVIVYFEDGLVARIERDVSLDPSS